MWWHMRVKMIRKTSFNQITSLKCRCLLKTPKSWSCRIMAFVIHIQMISWSILRWETEPVDKICCTPASEIAKIIFTMITKMFTRKIRDKIAQIYNQRMKIIWSVYIPKTTARKLSSPTRSAGGKWRSPSSKVWLPWLSRHLFSSFGRSPAFTSSRSSITKKKPPKVARCSRSKYSWLRSTFTYLFK